MAESLTNGSRLIWWILTIFSGLIGIGIVALTTSMNTMSAKINALEVAQAGVLERIRQLDGLADKTRDTQIERTTKFSELALKMGELSNNDKIMEMKLEGLRLRIDELLRSKRDSIRDLP